jgi:Uma2 family endonuclease
MSAAMSRVAHPVFYTFAEYIRLEEDSSIKHEYLGGQIYAMAGGTIDHAALAAALLMRIGNALEGRPCRAYTSDLRIRVRKTGLATYPDASVVCGPVESDPESKHTVTNPVLLVEVTSKSTEQYDRTEKLDHYREIASLRECVLVSHRERAIEVHRRDEAGRWTVAVAREGEKAELASVGCVLDVTALYDAATEPAA